MENDFIMNINTDVTCMGDNLDRFKNVPSICIMEGVCDNDVKYTIAIPTYKRSVLLKETIDSCLNQKGFDKYNIIVVDNNPERDDETEIMMRNYKNTIVSYFKNNENLTPGGNWNRCLKLAKGEWFVLLHDDDTITSNFLYEVDKVARKHKDAGFIQTAKCFNKKRANWRKSIFNYRKLSLFDAIGGAGIIGVPTGIVYRKDICFALGGFPYDSHMPYNYWFNTICIERYKCYKILKNLTYYRIGVNMSFDSSIHATWIVNDYKIIKHVCDTYKVPSFILDPYIANYLLNMERGLRRSWKSTFIFPKDISLGNYSKWRMRLTGYFVCYFCKLLRVATYF
jgi:glycosyltransferase involved in cell wall biosynthesis